MASQNVHAEGVERVEPKAKFRVGQTVQSIYDAKYTFVIDRSVVPERIFREKGSNRWWTRNELQCLGAPENPATSIRLNGKDQMRVMHPECAEPTSNGPQIVAGVSTGLEEQKCLECGIRFHPRRHWQKFHAEACRREFWKSKGDSKVDLNRGGKDVNQPEVRRGTTGSEAKA
jgi:hypothetical protein